MVSLKFARLWLIASAVAFVCFHFVYLVLDLIKDTAEGAPNVFERYISLGFGPLQSTMAWRVNAALIIISVLVGTMKNLNAIAWLSFGLLLAECNLLHQVWADPLFHEDKDSIDHKDVKWVFQWGLAVAGMLFVGLVLAFTASNNTKRPARKGKAVRARSTSRKR